MSPLTAITYSCFVPLNSTFKTEPVPTNVLPVISFPWVSNTLGIPFVFILLKNVSTLVLGFTFVI